jgi:hypothetical protein
MVDKTADKQQKFNPPSINLPSSSLRDYAGQDGGRYANVFSTALMFLINHLPQVTLTMARRKKF